MKKFIAALLALLVLATAALAHHRLPSRSAPGFFFPGAADGKFKKDQGLYLVSGKRNICRCAGV